MKSLIVSVVLLIVLVFPVGANAVDLSLPSALPVMAPFNQAPFYFEPQSMTPLAQVTLPTISLSHRDLSLIDDGLAAWGELAMTGDISTSLNMAARYNQYHEGNIRLGAHPSTGEYYGIWSGMTALNAAILLSPLPHWFKDTFFFGEGAVETSVVSHNLSAGLRFAF